jgi:hypothetical protein
MTTKHRSREYGCDGFGCERLDMPCDYLTLLLRYLSKLYSSSTTASETMAQATPEKMKANMEEWIHWKDEASKTDKIDFGLPLQAVGHITPEGTTNSTTQVSGYSIVEGDSKDDIIALLQTHPQLKRPGASLDVLEMLSMPGL